MKHVITYACPDIIGGYVNLPLKLGHGDVFTCPGFAWDVIPHICFNFSEVLAKLTAIQLNRHRGEGQED